MGINGIGMFLGDSEDLAEAVVRHIDHVAQLTGPEHVGISLDYVFDEEELVQALKDKPAMFPALSSGSIDAVPMAGPESYLPIVEGLARLGYTEADLRKILGGNWRRVAEQVWR